MLIFVYGDDNFRVAQKVRQMKDAFREKFDPTGLNTVEFPDAMRLKSEIGNIMNAARSLPFLGQKRMVIIRGLIETTKKEDVDIWVQGFKAAPESTIVIFWETAESKILGKKPMFEALKSSAQAHHYPFPLLVGPDLNKWVLSRVKERGGIIDASVAQELVSRVGSDLWQMSHEIEKLVAYAGGSKITKQMVSDLVDAGFEKRIFALMDAVSQHRREDAIRLLKEERLAGSDDHYLLTMLGRQVRILLGARAMLDENPRATKQELASAMALNPFVAQKALAQARSFTIEGLKAVHDLLFEFDEQIKTGKLDVNVAVDLTAVKLIG